MEFGMFIFSSPKKDDNINVPWDVHFEQSKLNSSKRTPNKYLIKSIDDDYFNNGFSYTYDGE